MKRVKYLFACLVVLCGLMGLGPNQAEAAKLEWHTTDLYYEMGEGGNPENVLVIEGYFHNNTDRYINYIYEFNLSATINSPDGSGTISGTFQNFDKMIEPYSDSSHTFRITNARIFWPVESYSVKGGYARWKNSKSAG